MIDRLSVARILVLLLSLTLAACEGPTGPEGPAGPAGESGPGTRLVLSGTISAAGVPDTVAVLWGAELPPEAGTLNDPPAISCWLSADGVFWLNDFCDFVESEDRTFLIVLLLGANGWQYRIVVVY